MRNIKDRTEIALHVSQCSLVTAHVWEARPKPVMTWGDEFPIVRLGSEVGLVDEDGDVFTSIEAAFVSRGGCGCLATASVQQAVTRIAEFLGLVAMEAKPSEIARLCFHGEMFMFETFSDSMEQRKLVRHVDGDLVEGYHPLELTHEGERGLRMCLESDMVDLPSRIYQEAMQLLKEPEPVLALPSPPMTDEQIAKGEARRIGDQREAFRRIGGRRARRPVARKRPALV